MVAAIAARAANPSCTCDEEAGCHEEKTTTHDIGRGVLLTLPDGWTYFSYPTAPDPIMAGLREVRAFKKTALIVISPFPNIDQREISESRVHTWIYKSASTNYVQRSKEQDVNFVSISHDDLVGGYASFTAASADKPFGVVSNRRHSSVTTFVISYKFVIFSISVASEDGPNEDYSAALDAIRNIK